MLLIILKMDHSKSSDATALNAKLLVGHASSW